MKKTEQKENDVDLQGQGSRGGMREKEKERKLRKQQVMKQIKLVNVAE